MKDHIIKALKKQMYKAGITPPETFKIGELNRFSDNEKRYKKSGWYVLHINSNGSVGAAFGNWKKGIKQKWFYTPDGKTLSKEERKKFNEQLEKDIQRANRKRRELQSKAEKKAKEIWEKAESAKPKHHYLIKKQIKAYGIKQYREALIAPIYSENKIISLQRIFPNSKKRFLKNGKIKGGFLPIGDTDNSEFIYIGEGYATMATIYEATEISCIVAFNADNLKPVAQVIKKKYSNKKIIITADNDIKTKEKTGKNTGIEAAEEAARSINAKICICPVASDFNDLSIEQGLDAVKQSLKSTKYPEPVKIETSEFEPLPLIRETEAAQPYPFEALGQTIGGAAKVMHEIIQAPDAICAQSVLGYAIHSVQGHADIFIDGKRISLNEFFISIGSKSSRKSECDIEAGKIHEKIQSEQKDKYKQDKKLYDQLMRAYRKKQEKIINNGLELAEQSKELNKLSKQEPKTLYEPLLVFSDPTVEGIFKLFLNGTPSKFLCADEGGQVVSGYSMSMEKKIYTAASYSKHWDGASINRIRGGDGVDVIKGTRLSMHLMLQDKIAMQFFIDEDIQNQGFSSRFLFAFPKSLVGNREYKDQNVSGIPEMQKFHEKIKENLLKPLPLKIDEKTGKELNELHPITIILEPDAKKIFIKFYNEIEERQKEKNDLATISGFAGKVQRNHVLKIAGSLAMFDDINRKTIPIQYVKQAIRLMEYYLNERLRLKEIGTENVVLTNAKKFLKWIQDKKLKIITLPDVYMSSLRIFKNNKEKALQAIHVLESYGYLKKIDGGAVSERDGKKRREAWAVYQNFIHV